MKKTTQEILAGFTVCGLIVAFMASLCTRVLSRDGNLALEVISEAEKTQNLDDVTRNFVTIQLVSAKQQNGHPNFKEIMNENQQKMLEKLEIISYSEHTECRENVAKLQEIIKQYNNVSKEIEKTPSENLPVLVTKREQLVETVNTELEKIRERHLKNVQEINSRINAANHTHAFTGLMMIGMTMLGIGVCFFFGIGAILKFFTKS
jgi:hypothetical protein